jgi:hypothetical protein
MKPFTSAVLALVLAACAWTDVGACGDKFFRIGRNMRYQRRYVAVHPASVLIYEPARNSAPARIKDLPKLLKQAGHHPSVVTNRAALTSALAAGGIDVVLAGLDDIQLLRTETVALIEKPTIIPVLIGASKAQVAEAEAAHHAAIHAPDQDLNDALAQIDRAIDSNAKAPGPARR